MFLLFLYHRIHLAARAQLEAVRRGDLDAMERHTAEREEATQALCEALARSDEPLPGRLGAAHRRRIHRLTTSTLDIDCEIREHLLRALDACQTADSTAGVPGDES